MTEVMGGDQDGVTFMTKLKEQLCHELFGSYINTVKWLIQ